MKTNQTPISLSLLTLTLLTTLPPPILALTGTACCWNADLSCRTREGKTPDGKHYAMCFKEGDHVLTQDEADVAKCLTDLHVAQGTSCIDTKGSKCENKKGPTADIHRAQIAAFIKDEKIDRDTGEVIKAALDQAVGDRLSLLWSDTNWLTIARTADNGNGGSVYNGELNFFNHLGNDC